MKKKTRNRLCVSLCLAMQASLFAGGSCLAEEVSGYKVNEALNLEEEVTLSVYGPGIFSKGGLDGTTDIVTGFHYPGYSEIIERWNELYPNCTLEITETPWADFNAAITTAALDGKVDVMMHGHGTGLQLDLRPYSERSFLCN